MIITIFVVIYLLPKVLLFFLPFVIGWILSVIANPLVKFLEKHIKLVRKHSSMIIIIVVLALLVTGGYFAIAKIGGEIIGLLNNLPNVYLSASNEFNEVGIKLQVVFERLPQNIQQGLLETKNNFSTYMGNMVGLAGVPTVEAAGNFAKNLPSRLISVIMTILSSYFFIAERDKILEFVNKTMPYSIKKNIDSIIMDFKKVVGGYFKAQFKIMFIVAAILMVGLSVLKVDYAIIWSLLISILDFLPFFGTGTALIPWAVVKFMTGDYRMAIGLVVIYAVSQLIRQLIQPKIVGDTIGLNPLATLIFLYIGYKFKGVVGMILAIPFGMILINLYKRGIFNNFLKNVKEVLKDINEFRKI
jgi:sporulation integral membrane protein YtvI